MKISEIQQKFREHLPSASPAVHRAMVWIMEHAPELAWSSIESLSHQAAVSPATIVRAVQTAGFTGYVELQKLVRDQSPPSSVAWRLFQDRPQEADIVASVVAQELGNLQQLGSLLRPQVPLLRTWLAERPRMLVTASLMTTGLGEHLAMHLRLLLGHVDFVDASSSEAWLELRDLEPNDGVIGLSYPRYSRATTQFLRECRQQTQHLLWITDMGGPELNGAELTIRLPSSSVSHYSSTVGLMAMLHILARELAEEVPDRVRNNLVAADKLWQKLNHPANSHEANQGGQRDV